MKFCLLLLLISMQLVRAKPPLVQVRVLTIQKAGASRSLEACKPDCDGDIYAALMTDVTAGLAQIVFDQTVMSKPGQRAKTEAAQQLPVLTQAQVDRATFTQYPELAFQNIGHALELDPVLGSKAIVGAPPNLISLNIAQECSCLLAMHPWPVPDLRGAGSMGKILYPIIGLGEINASLVSWTGRTVLVSVAPSPESALSNEKEPKYCYTFLRAGLDGEKAYPQGKMPLELGQLRLHRVSFRLPSEKAAALLLEPSADATIYEQLCQQVTNGTAILSEHEAQLTKTGQRAKVKSAARFQTAHHLSEMIPETWEARNHGVEFEVYPAGPLGHWNFEISNREGPEMIEVHPDPTHPELHGAVAEWIERTQAAQVSVSSSGVLCSGVISATSATKDESDSESLSDISFLVQSPPPSKSSTAVETQVLVQAFVLSVPATQGPGLRNLKQSVTVPLAKDLLAQVGQGEISLAAHAGTMITEGQRSRVECVRQVQQPNAYIASISNPKLQLPRNFAPTPCGLHLEMAYTDGFINGFLEWDTAPVLPFGAAGAPFPKLEERRCTEKIELKDLFLQRNQPIIADVRASKAREGTPEHGRWHVLILLAR